MIYDDRKLLHLALRCPHLVAAVLAPLAQAPEPVVHGVAGLDIADNVDTV